MSAQNEACGCVLATIQHLSDGLNPGWQENVIDRSLCRQKTMEEQLADAKARIAYLLEDINLAAKDREQYEKDFIRLRGLLAEAKAREDVAFEYAATVGKLAASAINLAHDEIPDAVASAIRSLKRQSGEAHVK